MSTEIALAGMDCNLTCTHCYENPMRDAGNFGSGGYDFEAIKQQALKRDQAITLFGGEALVAPIERVEELLQFSHANWGGANVQTNGTLISTKHMNLFKRYNVHVGVSVDGPGELNDIRWAGTLEKTREMTERTIQNIYAMREWDIELSIIITLHKLNIGKRLPVLQEWIQSLYNAGINYPNSIRLHVFEVDQPAMKLYMPSIDEYTRAYLDLFAFEDDVLPSPVFDKSNDFRKLLGGDDRNVTCIWTACDVSNTQAVQGIAPDGSMHNCGMALKDGVDYVKSDEMGPDRSIALYHTPQEHGGCQGCRFFLMCQGGCPGEGIDKHWLNRTSYCELWKALFTYTETRLLKESKHPLSLSPNLAEIEQRFMADMLQGKRPKFFYLLPQDRGPGHGGVAPSIEPPVKKGGGRLDEWKINHNNEGPSHQNEHQNIPPRMRV